MDRDSELDLVDVKHLKEAQMDFKGGASTSGGGRLDEDVVGVFRLVSIFEMDVLSCCHPAEIQCARKQTLYNI